ncbi:hypothetical protein ALI22I_29270 [Saccharothrix sp. ALI-22-I]|uniref:hypothetical protein n=1 Tax=Saccharothrix sp. ALI-22-I TaxID=1933778 RepID=UPI00097C6952|nr:hypothetical protein [Saccharothrix sp. ALI-22-I]ONI84635.1 hypothetical protein ALI22I_29270 [Saccharothrix sp. ALI-22-I]
MTEQNSLFFVGTATTVLRLGPFTLLTDPNMDGEQGVDLLELLRPRHAVPIHYDDYGVMKSPLSAFAAEVERRNPPAAVTYLDRGQTFTLPG